MSTAAAAYSEIWAIAAVIALLLLPAIENFYRLDVSARVVMTPIEKQRKVALAYERPNN